MLNSSSGPSLVAGVSGTGTFLNNGFIQSTNNGSLILENLINSGTVSESNGGWLTLYGNWSNNGTITVNKSFVQTDGTFTTADLQDIQIIDGTLELSGYMNNSGKTVALDSFTGAWPLVDTTHGGGDTIGTIEGGTISAVNPAGLVQPASTGPGIQPSGILDNVTLGTDLTINNVLYLEDTLNLSGNTVTVSGTIYAQSAATFGGTGTIQLQSPNDANELAVSGTGTLTIGPNVTVLTTGSANLIGTTGKTLLNQGTISVQSGDLLGLKGNWVNTGTLQAISNGVLQLGGSFSTAGLGYLHSAGGTIQFTGALDNTNQTLALNAITGSPQLFGGTITGGTISTSGGAQLVTTNTGTLDTVTLAGDVLVGSGTTTINNSLTLANARILFSSPNSSSIAEVSSNGSAAILGNGTILFDGSSTGANEIVASNGTLTIGSGIYTTTDISSGTIGGGSGTLLNQGTIVSAIASHDIVMAGNWINNGTFVLSGGTLSLGGTFTTGGTGSFQNPSGGTIAITGSLNNTNATLRLDHNSGTIELRGGQITGGTITTLDGTNLVINSGGGTFNNVTVAGNVLAKTDILRSTGGLNFGPTGQITLNGTAMNSYGTETIGGSGQIVFNGANQSTINPDSTGLLTIGPDITIASGLGGGTIGSGGSWINQGIISVQTAAKSVGLAGSWSSIGTLALSNGSLDLGGSFTTAGIGTLQRSGGTLSITGTLNNTNSVFALKAATGTIRFQNGTILGGTLTTADGSELLGHGTLDGVAIAGSVRNVDSTLTLTPSTTFAGGHIHMDSSSQPGALALPSNSAIVGPGEIDFDSLNFVTAQNGTIVIGAGTTARTENGSGTFSTRQTAGLINQGTLSADVSGDAIAIAAMTLTNQSLIQSINGGSFLFVSPSTALTSTNTGTILAASGGTVSLMSVGSLGALNNSGTILAQSAGQILSCKIANSGTILASTGPSASPTAGPIPAPSPTTAVP